MAAINFPDSPSNGDTHVVGGVTYTYDSTETKWKTTINSNAFLPLTGGTLSGNLNMGTNDLTVGDVTASGTASLSGLTYPTSDGTTGQYLQTDGAGALSWQTVAVPDAVSVAVIADVKSVSTHGGTFTSGAWRTRDLNTEIQDSDNIVTISSNQFTLIPGTYVIQFAAPAYGVSYHRARLYDITNSTVIAQGINCFDYPDPSLNADQGISSGVGRVLITSNTTYEIQHRCALTQSPYGLGLGCNLSSDEQFTTVTIWKVA
jgi:hypothetical protein